MTTWSVRLYSGIEPEMVEVGNQRLAQCANERTQWQDDVQNLVSLLFAKDVLQAAIFQNTKDQVQAKGQKLKRYKM